MSVPGTALADARFDGTWRRYQLLALDAFARDMAAGRRRTHVVAPPGSGKTVMGLEMARRLGVPAAVLVPNTAVQAQWVRAAAAFSGGEGLVSTEPGGPVTVLTYQSLCRLDDPAVLLGDLAERRWAAERAAATGMSPEEAAAEAAGWEGAARDRRRREVARIGAALKREIARAEHGDLHLGALLEAGARERIAALRSSGVGTVVLDECHHLASMWGYAVRVMVEELGDVHVVGLTATPPDELSAAEHELYAHLLGEVDFEVPTPAVVRDGHLAPFQELAWLTPPLASEADWLAERDRRFRELVTALHEDADGPRSFPGWVLTRMRERTRGDEDAAVSWAGFQRRHPALARAGARFVTSAGLAAPEGMPRGEGYREPPDTEDWLVLLQDYALRCLGADPSAEAAERLDAIGAALRELGYTLTRQGIRRGASDVDRVLTGSAAKALGLVEVLAIEAGARGTGLRGLVLCDAESAPARADASLTGVLPAGAGTAAEAVRALAADARTAVLRPLLVTGRGLRCAPDDAEVLLAALAERAGGAVDGWRWEVDGDGLARLGASGAAWVPRLWVGLATGLLTDGPTMALVGTRALLGEGWDAPCVNALVDLTAATTRVSVTQMRGRSLRLDPADPLKLASNWDVVCVAEGHARGDADYRRFVRRHAHLFAPADDGVIEAGPAHVHPALGPFAAPPAASFGEVNRQMARRAADRDRARTLWAIGTPYRGEEHTTLVVRPAAGAGSSGEPPEAPPAFPLRQRGPVALAAAGAAGALGVLAAGPVALAALVAVPAGLGWAAVRLGRVRGALAGTLPLEAAAAAVRDAYLALGELSPEAAASMAIEPRASGYLRVWLREGTAEERDRFATALGELVDPPPAARYVVSRLVPGGRSRMAALARVLARRPPFGTRWLPVPADLARRKERAEAFHAAWRRWLGPSELRFTQREDDGRAAMAAAAAQAPDHRAGVRRVWV